jgi:protein arginine N-methyltransferase 1
MAYSYSLAGYGMQLVHRGRIEAYREALRRRVTPDSVVLDIGTGTGILAMLACQCGARRVYAVDPTDLIHLGREMAAANGYAHRIRFIQDLSTRITLPEPVDVIVSDIRGALPLFQQAIPALVDARRRFLAPQGRLIPRQDTLRAALVQMPQAYRRLLAPWKKDMYGLDLRGGRAPTLNSFHKVKVRPAQLLEPAQTWGTFDYETVASPDIRGKLSWEVSRRGKGHGLVLWFDTLLTEGVGFSNAPGEPIEVYGRVLFPWLKPVDLAPGDRVTVELAADLVGNDYIFRWDTRVVAPYGGLKAEFRQSTFYGTPLSPARLRLRTPGHVPSLGAEGRVTRFILELMDGQHSLEDIARRLMAEFPGQFASESEALNQVGELSVTFGQPPA